MKKTIQESRNVKKYFRNLEKFQNTIGFIDAGKKEDILKDKVKEALFHMFEEEILYKVAVNLEEFTKKNDGSVVCKFNLIVRSSYKPIILARIKTLSINSRKLVQNFLKKKVHLYLNLKLD